MLASSVCSIRILVLTHCEKQPHVQHCSESLARLVPRMTCFAGHDDFLASLRAF